MKLFFDLRYGTASSHPTRRYVYFSLLATFFDEELVELMIGGDTLQCECDRLR